MTLKRSPLAPVIAPDLPALSGVMLATTTTDTRYKGRDDLMLACLAPGTTIAGCLTRSKSPSAPVDWCRDHLKSGQARAIMVNAGNANAFTGKAGSKTVSATANAAAKALDCQPQQVFIASTGVIGETLDSAPIVKAMPELAGKLADNNWQDAAKAIMTTDTFAKTATISTKLAGRKVTINAIAKGSGMIAPDMATMLVFIFTDAALPATILQKLLTRAVNQSFNCITVDSDTSTSDTVLLCATGARKERPKALRSLKDSRLKGFTKALDKLTRDLALQVVKDGEGASKLIAIKITGAQNDAAAHKIAMSIANSPLVKTAIAGEDANWGRIVMAVGKAGERAERDLLRIKIGGILVARKGVATPGYNEADLVPHMQGQEIDIAVDLGIGKGHAQVWTCDLTHDYIDINGSYRS